MPRTDELSILLCELSASHSRCTPLITKDFSRQLIAPTSPLVAIMVVVSFRLRVPLVVDVVYTTAPSAATMGVWRSVLSVNISAVDMAGGCTEGTSVGSTLLVMATFLMTVVDGNADDDGPPNLFFSQALA
ncbi:hypothetical protein B0H11DRAFT_2193126 [Mycena galericulata]|nr:hypothetical protein B0H11DRAFT_2193126 [Mycena galericulata]